MLMQNGEIVYSKPYPSPTPCVTLQEITYYAKGVLVKGLLAIPQTYQDGLIYLRGGIQRVGMVRPARIAEYAQQGFIVFAPYYRGNRGGQGRDEFVGVDRYDAIYAVDVLRAYWKGDIHLLGFSRGVTMALWTAIERDDISSVVVWGGMTDVALTYSERMDMRRMMKRVIGGTPTKVPDAYEARTPLRHVHKIAADVLIIHGVKDYHVSITHSELLQRALPQASTWYYKDYGHAFPPAIHRQTVNALTTWMKEAKS